MNADQVVELLRMNCVSQGFPDCGHLLSSNSKDIKSRIKCIQALLLKHKQDLEFRKKVNQPVDLDAVDTLKKKLERYKNSIS